MNEMREMTLEEKCEIKPVLENLKINPGVKIFGFIDTSLDKVYDVYLLGEKDKVILKKCGEGRDIIKYDKYFTNKNFNVPKIIRRTAVNNEEYVLMEYVGDTDGRGCGEKQGSNIGIALAEIQGYFLTKGGHTEISDSYFKKEILCRKTKTAKFLPEIEKIFNLVEKRFYEVPHTLIHDDLLPINVLLNADKAYFIDWEYAKILPYFMDLGRFAFVYNEKKEMFIPKTSAKAFLNSYYKKISQNSLFNISLKEFNLDVAISAFCQYVLFCSFLKNETEFNSSLDGKYLKEIVNYMKNNI